MATLLTLKRRIKTTKNVSKTTKAMQMIAASKLKKAQDAAVSSKPYVEKLEFLSKNISHKLDKDSLHEYMKTNSKTKSKLILIVSPDKGLCGSLVTNLLKEVLRFESKEKIFYLTIGKKAENLSLSLNKEIVATFDFGTSLPPYENIYPIAEIIKEYFLSGKVSEVLLLSTKFHSVFTQKAEFNNILPIKLNEIKDKDSSITLFEPSVSELLPDLLNHYLEMIIYQNLLESYASEQAARMMAMKNATDNALDIISDLALEYNKTRQEKITNELLDIGGGAQISYE